jgi:hypothetical protein
VFPVRKRLLPVFAGIIFLTIAWFSFAATALAGDPRLSEFEAKQIATSYGGIREIVSKHIELERRASWNGERHVWEISWTNPANNRKVVAVELDDDTATVVSVNIRPEAYGDILPLLTESEAIDLAESREKVKNELEDKPDIDPKANLGDDRVWTVNFYSGNDTLAEVLVDDNTGTVTEVRVGPQVAWQMARGYPGAFGRIINEPYVWLPLCALFLAPFVDCRRPLRLLHLDLLVLLSFTVSHYYFNQGEIFRSVPLAYPPLAYLFFRLGYIAVWRKRRRRPASKTAPAIPAGMAFKIDKHRSPRLHLNFSPRVLFIVLVALLVFRITINIVDSNVVDVGYSGVIGAHRILEGTTPYGNMPAEDSNGDTYGPANYIAYIPFERILPWSGSWDDLPAAHVTAILFDLLAVAGMYFAGRRLVAEDNPGEKRRFGLALAWGWAAYPYTTYVLNCNVNDSIVAAFLIWGFVFLKAAPLAGVMLGFATQVKFFPALIGPLWASFPRAFHGWGRRSLFVLGFAAALAVTLPVIFMGDGTFSVFWERTIEWQLGRDSPFSIWGQHADTLAGVQRVGQYILIALALALYFWPPRKSLTRVAAASAALLVGFEILQTHWFYLYIPWFFPLALIALLGWTVRKPERGGRGALA